MRRRAPTKKQWIIIGSIAVVIAGAIAATYLLWRRTEPATGRLYLAQPTQRVTKGEEVPVAVRIDSYQPIDTVTATIHYDPEILQYKESTYDKARFDSSLPTITSQDTVMIQAAILGGKTMQEDAPVATLIFTARTDGNPSLSLSGGDAVLAGVATHPQLVPERKQ